MALTNIAREEEEEQRTLVNQFQADVFVLILI